MSQISTAILTGSCGCGAVRFELSAPLIGAAYCHCTRCQKRTGTAVQASARIAAASLTITSGEAELRDWTPPGGLAKSFCGICGSHLFGRDPASGDVVIVRMAAVDGDPVVRPTAHQFVAYAAPWEEIRDDGLPRFDERLPA
ncbi:MAG: GFA family protein [Actinomycetota bacterium]|nr:GFA family protein [Actinomycetota bacterium]